MSMVDSRYIGSGKVREIYEVGPDRILLVTSDRISAYDVVMEQPIPDKGRVLTALSHFWFETLAEICPHHCLSIRARDMPEIGLPDLGGRAMLCRRAEPLPVEFVVRGYLSGSGWRDYRSTGEICGHRLPDGLLESDRLPEPIVTPATKATSGHDENITETQAAEIVGPAYATARDYAVELYVDAAQRAADRGVIVADTKFEFGAASGGEVILIDEALTPDSSRFWPADRYRPGGPQPSFDKQFVRDWLDSISWDHNPPPPALPDDVVDATRARYVEAYERITGRSFDEWVAEATS
ncbi:MAG TPA: phosphoribosylaminoimidazolesuccinocarboxamide synthase [Actinomycetota bacterium]|nr:phosphoribosylaminoimidazolesuccinocarboxamide synthase [Actinomycetota bacterium]